MAIRELLIKNKPLPVDKGQDLLTPLSFSPTAQAGSCDINKKESAEPLGTVRECLMLK